MPHYPIDDENWVVGSGLDLFSPPNVHAVEAALAPRGALVIGWHYHYAGGSSRSDVCFSQFGDYLRHIERARPGDHFSLYALDHVAPRAFIRSGTVGSFGLSLDDHEWSELRDVLRDPAAEVVLVRRFVGPLTGEVVGHVELLNDLGEHEWDVLGTQIQSGLGELLLFALLDVFDADEVGDRVETVSPPPGRRRVHALVDAKRPDADRRVPLSGPY